MQKCYKSNVRRWREKKLRLQEKPLGKRKHREMQTQEADEDRPTQKRRKQEENAIVFEVGE